MLFCKSVCAPAKSLADIFRDPSLQSAFASSRLLFAFSKPATSHSATAIVTFSVADVASLKTLTTGFLLSVAGLPVTAAGSPKPAEVMQAFKAANSVSISLPASPNFPDFFSAANLLAKSSKPLTQPFNVSIALPIVVSGPMSPFRGQASDKPEPGILITISSLLVDSGSSAGDTERLRNSSRAAETIPVSSSSPISSSIGFSINSARFSHMAVWSTSGLPASFSMVDSRTAGSASTATPSSCMMSVDGRGFSRVSSSVTSNFVAPPSETATMGFGGSVGMMHPGTGATSVPANNPMSLSTKPRVIGVSNSFMLTDTLCGLETVPAKPTFAPEE
mmetsp:Transcript_47809/g.84726  ORF Transcript_47809/g.84726 Transcript_47809/m.84726 type:complete len:334 (-) Transcript_47809:664-1665(-)